MIAKIIPIKSIVVEDAKATSIPGKGKDFNKYFSHIGHGKNWFYNKIESNWMLFKISGFETSELRKKHGLKKSGNKKAIKFSSHCVDSWVIANSIVGGHETPDNTKLLFLSPIKLIRRQLHVSNFQKGGTRRSFGSTRTFGLKRGSIVKHPRFGACLIGGHSASGISLHCLETYKRICRNAKANDISFLSYNSFCFKEVAGA